MLCSDRFQNENNVLCKICKLPSSDICYNGKCAYCVKNNVQTCNFCARNVYGKYLYPTNKEVCANGTINIVPVLICITCIECLEEKNDRDCYYGCDSDDECCKKIYDKFYECYDKNYDDCDNYNNYYDSDDDYYDSEDDLTPLQRLQKNHDDMTDFDRKIEEYLENEEILIQENRSLSPNSFEYLKKEYNNRI